MIVAYCKTCLPAKVVVGFSNYRREADVPHEGHPYTQRNGLFPLTWTQWLTVHVEGDDVQTKANIVAQLGDKFE